jgi:colanic acid/amylovoran biosynthesis glycosyltransferase
MRRKLLSLGAPEERIRVLPIGLPLKGFAFRPRQLADGETMTLIAAARLTEVKGISWGLKGLALAREAGLDVRWEIFGDGPLRAELEALRAELGLEDAVTFHGFVPIQEVQRAMETAHACLFPGVAAADGAEEALGGAVLEAQACGLPVIASEVGGIPEGFVPGVSGYLVPQRDPEAIAKALRDLHDNREQWPTMGEAGHAHVQERYDCEALNERWERLYDGLVAGTLPTQAEIDAPLTRSTKG